MLSWTLDNNRIINAPLRGFVGLILELLLSLNPVIKENNDKNNYKLQRAAFSFEC